MLGRRGEREKEREREREREGERNVTGSSTDDMFKRNVKST